MIEKLLLYSSLFAAGVIVCGMLGCLVPIIGKLKWTKSPLMGLPSSTRIILLLLAVGLTFVGATKTNRTNGVSSSLGTSSQVSRVGSTNALEQANGSVDTARFLDIAVATNGTVSLVAHRPADASDVAQDVVVVATTNLCTPTWFALTNTTFAAGETNLSVMLSREFLASCAITNLGIFSFCGTGDSDGDGLDDWEERFQLRTDPFSRDTDRDGDDDRWEVAMGFNPCRNEPGIQLTNAIARTANYDLLYGFSGSSLTVTNRTGTVVTPVEQSLSPTIGQNELPQLADDWLDPFGFTWTDCFTPRAAGVYTFTIEADDEASLSIAGSSAYTSWWTHHAYDPQSVSVGLKAGVSYPISVTYANFGGPALLSITTSFVGDPGYNPGLEVTPHVVHIGPSGDAEEDWPVAAITGTMDPDVTYSIQVEMTEGLSYDASTQRVMPDRSGSFWTDGATATAVFRLYGDGDEIASDQCVFVYSAPKEPERSCGCGGYGTEVENGCVHFAQPFGATPSVPGLPTGRIVVQVSEPSATLYTPAVLRYDHPMMRRMIYRRNLDAIVVDALGNVTEYRRGLPSGVSAGRRGQLFRRTDGAFVEELADGLRVVYVADGTVAALQPEHAAPIAVADLGIVVSTNSLGWVTNVSSVADGQMTTTVFGANAWRLTWTGPNGSTAKTFDFGGDGTTTFTLTEQRGDGAFAFSHRWTYDADARDWLLEKGADSDDAVRTVRTKVYDETNRVWRITQSKTDASGAVLACESSVLDRNGHAPRVTERRDVVTGQRLYAATLDASGRVVCETNALGAVTSYDYDAFGRVTQKTVVAAGMPTETTSFGYSTDIAPIDFRPVWKRTSADGQTLLEESFADVLGDDGTVTRTHTRTAAGTTRANCEVFDALGRTILVVAEDGRATRTIYAELVDGGWTATEDDGVVDESGFALVLGRSTREVRRYSAQGNVTRRERYALVDESWWLLDSSEMSYDAAHRKTATAFSDGTTEGAGWICSGPVWTRGRDGILVTNLYDAAKQKCASIRQGPFGDVRTAYTRDGVGRVVAETTTAANCETQMVTRVYDSRGRVTSETSANGTTTTTSYSADDRVTTITNADGGTQVTTQNADGTVASLTGTAVTPEYTAYGVEAITVNGVATTCRTKTVRMGSVNSPRFEKTFVNGFGETVRVERSGFGGATLVTENEYDAQGRLVSTTETGKPTVTYAYDDWGDLASTMQSADGVTRTVEQAEGYALLDGEIWQGGSQTVRTSDASIAQLVTESYVKVSNLSLTNIAERFSVDVRGNTNRTWSALDPTSATRTTRTRQAGIGNLSFTEAVDGETTLSVDTGCVTNRTTYDAFRRVLTKIDGHSNTMTYAYDALGRLASMTDAATNTTRYVYDAMGRVTEMTNALGNVTFTRYDACGNKTYEGGATYPVNYTYDVFGNRTSMTTYRDESSGAGDTTTWLYDEAMGLVTNKVYAGGHGPTYAYDMNGRVLQRTWARGVVTTYSYDGWGALVRTEYSDDTPAVTLAYDSMGRQVRATDAAGTTTFAYNVFGVNTNETVVGVAGTNVIERFTDMYGRDAGYTLNGIRQSTLDYDPATGRLAMMLSAGSETPFTWSYLAGSDLKSSLAYPNGLTASWTYDNRNQLLEVCNDFPTNVISQYAYTYDAVGRRIGCDKSGSAFDTPDAYAYLYNARSELTNATASIDATFHYGYAFDDIGNRRTSAERGTNSVYTASQLNQYMTVNDFTPTYDVDGNQTVVKTATGIWRVTYNGENRPIRWENGDMVITMSFDRMGRRVTKNDQCFIYDGYLQIADNSGNAYVWDPTENIATLPLVWKRGNSVAYYTHDGNKNVSEVVTSNIDVAVHYEYAPFGAVMVSTRNSTSTTYDFCAYNPFRFSSEYADDTLGLVYYNYRHYEPVIGRWLNVDLAPTDISGLNKYAYCYNYPLALTDYIGLAGKTTHGTRKCHDTDSCSDLAIKLSDWIKHYEERHKELLEDKLGLKTNDPHRYNNHIDEATKAVKNINNCADKILSHKPPCGCPLEPIPVLSPLPERVSELTTCQKIALRVPFSDETLWTVQRGCLCVAAGATIGAVAVGSVPAVTGGLAGGSLPASRILPVFWQ